ncbi:MAG: hypothetical protein VCB77_05390 [Alphaproteobacteria bacterium]
MAGNFTTGRAVFPDAALAEVVDRPQGRSPAGYILRDDGRIARRANFSGIQRRGAFGFVDKGAGLRRSARGNFHQFQPDTVPHRPQYCPGRP